MEDIAESSTPPPPAQEEEKEIDISKPGKSAVKFLQNINHEDLDLCIFEESLVTTSDDGKTIGEFSASVKKTTHLGETVFLVQANSKGKVDDTPMGTTLTTYLNSKDLSLIKQQHYEYVKVPHHEMEKKTDMKVNISTGELVVKREVTMGDGKQRVVYTFSQDELLGFVTEGTNLLLQRLLIRQGLDEELQFVTLDSDSGRLVQAVYKPLPERSQQVGKTELNVLGIERSVMSIAALPHTWQSFFLPDGHLTMRVQVGSPAVVTLEKVPRLIERDEHEAKPVFGKVPLIWEEDMEMHSRFLHRKEELKADHERYMREHPEASALVADFFQFLLLRKPEDVVTFSADFFSTFSNIIPETSAYKHSSSENIPNDTLNSLPQ